MNQDQSFNSDKYGNMLDKKTNAASKYKLAKSSISLAKKKGSNDIDWDRLQVGFLYSFDDQIQMNAAGKLNTENMKTPEYFNLNESKILTVKKKKVKGLDNMVKALLEFFGYSSIRENDPGVLNNLTQILLELEKILEKHAALIAQCNGDQKDIDELCSKHVEDQIKTIKRSAAQQLRDEQQAVLVKRNETIKELQAQIKEYAQKIKQFEIQNQEIDNIKKTIHGQNQHEQISQNRIQKLQEQNELLQEQISQQKANYEALLEEHDSLKSRNSKPSEQNLSDPENQATSFEHIDKEKWFIITMKVLLFVMFALALIRAWFKKESANKTADLVVASFSLMVFIFVTCFLLYKVFVTYWGAVADSSPSTKLSIGLCILIYFGIIGYRAYDLMKQLKKDGKSLNEHLHRTFELLYAVAFGIILAFI